MRVTNGIPLRCSLLFLVDTVNSVQTLKDEHQIQPDNGAAYTVCYDAIKKEVAKVNPTIVPVGPEIAGTSGAVLVLNKPIR
jgi:hypothetical protein